MKKGFLYALVATLSVAACVSPVEHVPSIDVTGADLVEGAVSVSAEEGTVSLTVVSNVSWAAESDAEWLTIAPASATVADYVSTTTTVVLSVDENDATAPRTANVTITVENLTPVTVSLTQAGAEPTFEVLKDRQPVSTVEVAEAGGTTALVVNSNLSWTAVASASWLTVSPASYTNESGLLDPKTLSVVAEAATSTKRSATVTVSAEGQTPVVVTFNQEAAVPLSVKVGLLSVSEYAGQPIAQYPDQTCLITIMEEPTEKIVAGYYGLWQSAAWEQSELDDLETAAELLAEYGNAMEADELDGLNGVEGADPCEWVWSKLISGTEYVFVAYFESESGKKYVGYAKKETAKEEEGGEATEAYSKWIGSYTFNINGTQYPAVISQKVANKSFTVDLSGNDQYVEDFAAVADYDAANDVITIAAQQVGQWNHPTYGTVTDTIYGLISYNGGYPMITGNGYAIAKIVYNSGNPIIQSAGKISINGLGDMDLVGFSLFGVTSAGNLRYCDEEDFMFFPVQLTAAASNAPAKVSAKKIASASVKKATLIKESNVVLR